METFSAEDFHGVVIHENTVNEREVRLFASPDCPVRRENFACGMAVIASGQVHEEHVHPDSDELILVYQGQGTGTVGGKELTISRGDVIAIDRGEPHTFTNTGREDLCLYWVYSPPGPEKKYMNGEQRAFYDKNNRTTPD